MMTAASPAPLQTRLDRWLKDEFSPRQFITSLNAAVILWLFEIILVVSFAAVLATCFIRRQQR